MSCWVAGSKCGGAGSRLGFPRQHAAAEQGRQVRGGVVHEPKPEAARSRKLPWPPARPGATRAEESRGSGERPELPP